MEKLSDLETLAAKLDAIEEEVENLGEDRVAKAVRNAAKAARFADKQRSNRLRKVGNLVTALKAKGLSAEQIVSRLTAGQA